MYEMKLTIFLSSKYKDFFSFKYSLEKLYVFKGKTNLDIH